MHLGGMKENELLINYDLFSLGEARAILDILQSCSLFTIFSILYLQAWNSTTGFAVLCTMWYGPS